MASIDLSQLAPPVIVEALDYPTIYAALEADLLARDPTLANALSLQSEPLVKLLQVAAYRELDVRAAFNQRARGALMAFAVGADLDNLAANLGVVREAGELDPALRARALLSLDGQSTAGPVGAYVYHALSADPAVADVAVSSPAPGQVRVVVLSKADDGVAAPDLLAAVAAALNADEVRPLTDQVSVVSAAVAPYAVDATLSVLPGPDSGTVLTAALAAVNGYAAAQRRLGKPVRRNALVAALLQPGVDDVELRTPADDLPPTPEVAPVLAGLTVAVAVELAGG